MTSTLAVFLGLTLAAWASYRLLSGIVAVYRADRTRHRRLRALERAPLSVDPVGAAKELDQAVLNSLREDVTLTGAVLAALSVAGVFIGREMAFGQWAVGLYTAGLVGIVAGVALALVGGVLRIVTMPLLRENDGDG